MKFELNTKVNRLTRKKDASCTIALTTPKLTDEEFLAFCKIVDHEVDTTFKTTDEVNQDAHTIEVKTEVYEKTPSQRLHAVLFILWKQDYQGKYKTFDEFYQLTMENTITQFKRLLN